MNFPIQNTLQRNSSGQNRLDYSKESKTEDPLRPEAISVEAEGLFNLKETGKSNLPVFEGKSMDELQARAIPRPVQIDLVQNAEIEPRKSFALSAQLGQFSEQRALKILEQYLVNTEFNGDHYISRDDLLGLQAMSSKLPPDLVFAVNYFLNNPAQFNALDTASQQGATPDGYVGLSDFHARQLQVSPDIVNSIAPQNTGNGSYQSPASITPGGQISTSVQLESPQRDQQLFNDQQDVIETALRTGESVSFINSDNQVLNVSVNVSTTSGTGEYLVRVGEDSFYVSSEIDLEDTIAGIASIIEFGSTMGVPDSIRQFPDSVVFNNNVNDNDPNTAATYNRFHQMNFYQGDQYTLDPELYYHEIAHGIMHDLYQADIYPDGGSGISNQASTGTEGLNFIPALAPPGWIDVHNAAVANNNLVSTYANENIKESFAEAFSAYVNARNYGEAALDQFRADYPLQSAYLDEVVFGARPNQTQLS